MKNFWHNLRPVQRLVFISSIMAAHPPTFTRQREQTVPANDGSRTVTLDPTAEESSGTESEDDSIGILRLRGDPSARSPRQIQWADNVVDNENLGRKKSKSTYLHSIDNRQLELLQSANILFAVCCIYHRPKMPGDDSSSSDSSSDSGSDSDSDSANSGGHSHDPACKHHHGRGRSSKNQKKRNPRDVSPNAYERQPVYKSTYSIYN
jgi:protein phosphatase 1 regulatory subunit 11